MTALCDVVAQSVAADESNKQPNNKKFRGTPPLKR
jgi:hypothetical protein